MHPKSWECDVKHKYVLYYRKFTILNHRNFDRYSICSRHKPALNVAVIVDIMTTVKMKQKKWSKNQRFEMISKGKNF